MFDDMCHNSITMVYVGCQFIMQQIWTGILLNLLPTVPVQSHRSKTSPILHYECWARILSGFLAVSPQLLMPWLHVKQNYFKTISAFVDFRLK